MANPQYVGALLGTPDANLTLVAAGTTVTATGNSSSVQLGATDSAAFSAFDVIVDVSALDFANADETYTINVAGANAAGFGTKWILGTMRLGTAAHVGQTNPQRAGRYVIRCTNAITADAADTLFTTAGYVRLEYTLGGTTPSMTLAAYIVPAMA